MSTPQSVSRAFVDALYDFPESLAMPHLTLAGLDLVTHFRGE